MAALQRRFGQKKRVALYDNRQGFAIFAVLWGCVAALFL
jgi:hypothetical protein